MRKERLAFALQLARLKSGRLSSVDSDPKSKNISIASGAAAEYADVRREPWFEAIEQASSAGGTDAIAKIMPLMMKLRRSFEEDRVQTRLRHVVASIEGGSTKYQLLDEDHLGHRQHIHTYACQCVHVEFMRVVPI